MRKLRRPGEKRPPLTPARTPASAPATNRSGMIWAPGPYIPALLGPARTRWAKHLYLLPWSCNTGLCWCKVGSEFNRKISWWLAGNLGEVPTFLTTSVHLSSKALHADTHASSCSERMLSPHLPQRRQVLHDVSNLSPGHLVPQRGKMQRPRMLQVLGYRALVSACEHLELDLCMRSSTARES